MIKEDEESYAQEVAFRSDTALQSKLLEEKRRKALDRARIELERTNRAATAIERIWRGRLTRRKSIPYMCEKMLENALGDRSETQLLKAISMPGKLCEVALYTLYTL